MRPFLICVTFLVLVFGVLFCWQHRYCRTESNAEIALEDLIRGLEFPPKIILSGQGQSLALTLAAQPTGHSNALRLNLPGNSPSSGIRLSFKVRANKLIPGNEVWETGRVIIEWHKPWQAGGWEKIPVSSVRFDDVDEISGVVIQPDSPPAIPALRLENLGKSGTMELSGFHAQTVEESDWWRIGKWGLLCGFLGWSFALINSIRRIHRGRALCAAAIWVAMGWHLAVPGPWKIQRPLFQPFEIGYAANADSPPYAKLASLDSPLAIALPPSGESPSSGNIPLQGSLPLRVKFLITSARPFLHVLMFAVPAFLLTALAGRLPALYLCGLLAILVELSQWAYGYGFGWDDVGDIFTDAAGIASGIIACVWCWKRARNSAWKPLEAFGRSAL